MYVNDGKPMSYAEEGAAFFPPTLPPLGMVPPRTMGLDMQLLRQGFVSGVGDDAVVAEAPSVLSTPTPWLVAAAGAVVGFFLWRHK